MDLKEIPASRSPMKRVNGAPVKKRVLIVAGTD
jgi:hypothetical protein